ncbi:hypothetical protein [Kordiimonas sp.]|uniref:hypothetical protein n=1 Tax=Kordiimonas sp. TaxID=1970157 RepID=UPI003A92F8F2
MNLHEENVERFAVLQNLYYSGRTEEFQRGLHQWRRDNQRSPYIQYLEAIVARHQLAPASAWAADYEAGLLCKLRSTVMPVQTNRWHGQRTASQSITIWAEDGLGDFIRHASHIRRVERCCSELVVHLPEKIRPLFEQNFPTCFVTSSSEDAIRSDLHIASGSLDGLFWDASKSPQASGYLSAPEPVAIPQKNARKIRVGVCSRSTKLAWDRDQNYTNLAALAPIFQSEDVECHSLQYTNDQAEIEEAQSAFLTPIVSYPQFDFFDDITALSNVIASLDMVVATSTLVADLASALGVKTWRFHTIPGQRLIWSPENSTIFDTHDPSPGKCWYSDRTTVAYRGEKDSWQDFFGELAKHMF